eukprot:3535046-Prymnesium_polylepis.1
MKRAAGPDHEVLPLEREHPHHRDFDIDFEEETHTYTVTRRGEQERVPVSVTGFAKAYFKQFDAHAVVEKNYAKWKLSPESKYASAVPVDP